MPNILSHFRESYTPRPVQVAILNEIETHWNDYDVFIINADVGAGKSLMADCIAKWQFASSGVSTSIITPTNILVNQYLESCPDMTTMAKKCKFSTQGDYNNAKDTFKRASLKLANYFTYLAHRAYSPILIADEAHKLIPMLQDMEGMRIWKHILPYPDNVRTVFDLLAWATHCATIDLGVRNNKSVAKLISTISSAPDRYVIDIEEEMYKENTRERIRVYPLTPRYNKPILWPSYTVKKVVLMSATFGIEDLYDLGLDTSRVRKIEGPSPIPAGQRPIKYEPVGNMSYKHQLANLPRLVEKIEKLMEKHSEKGLIHCTYSLSARLRSRFMNNERIIWHNKENKNQMLKEWLGSSPKEGKVFVGCGLSEGLDLKGDRGRWQAICKIAYPNMGDVAIGAKLKQRPSWYNWMAVRDLEQARGRICRAEDDYGITYILDSGFARLFNNNKDMFSKAFKEALCIKEHL